MINVMKCTVKQVVDCYNLLEKAKATKLEVADVIKILEARKAMRPTFKEHEDFLKDCQEKFKPDNWDDVQAKVQQWQKEGENTTLTEAERIEINKALIGYQSKINEALKGELEREVEISVEQLDKESKAKMMVENGWTVSELEIVGVIL